MIAGKRHLAAALVAMLMTTPGHARPVAAPAAAAMPHISVTTIGSGSPIILIPGLSSPRAVWDGVAPALAAKHRVFLVQVNGFGGDDPKANLAPGILDGVVADLHDLIVREKLGAPMIVGHSMGGLLALMFARAHPGEVSRLMIVDSLPFYGMLFSPAATVAMVQPRAAAMRDQMIARYGKPADPAATDALVARLARKPSSRATVSSWTPLIDQRVSAEAMYEDLSTDLRPDLARIATPITLVYPWNAEGPTKEQADALYKGAYAAAPHMTYVDIGDAQHFVMLDQPAAFAAALTHFADGG